MGNRMAKSIRSSIAGGRARLRRAAAPAPVSGTRGRLLERTRPGILCGSESLMVDVLRDGKGGLGQQDQQGE